MHARSSTNTRLHSVQGYFRWRKQPENLINAVVLGIIYRLLLITLVALSESCFTYSLAVCVWISAIDVQQGALSSLFWQEQHIALIPCQSKEREGKGK
jgi:hypothetical protein